MRTELERLTEMVEEIELLKFLGVLLAIIIPVFTFAHFWHKHNIHKASERWTVNEINHWIDDMHKGFLPWNEQMLSDFIEMKKYLLKKQNERKDQSE